MSGALPAYRRPLGAALLSGLLLSGCSTGDSSDSAEEVYVATEPIDEVSVQAEPVAPASLAAGVSAVTFSWAGWLAGQPVQHDECVGMVALTAPDGRLISLDPSLTDCTGQTELVLDPAQTMPGDYRLNVILNGLNTSLFYTVAP